MIQKLNTTDQQILEIIKINHTPLNARQIMQQTQKPLGTVYYSLNKMIMWNIIQKQHHKNNKQGRPRITFQEIK